MGGPPRLPGHDRGRHVFFVHQLSQPGGGVSLPAVGIGLLDLVLLIKCRLGVPIVIGISALLGLLCFGVLGW